jgi:hypothetical protein
MSRLPSDPMIKMQGGKFRTVGASADIRAVIAGT